jgi:hypothetical protein
LNTKQKKKKNGEGSISLRPDGRWFGRLSVGINDSGKIIRRSVYGTTKAEVEAKLNVIKQSENTATPTQAREYAFKELGEQVEQLKKENADLRKQLEELFESCRIEIVERKPQ